MVVYGLNFGAQGGESCLKSGRRPGGGPKDSCLHRIQERTNRLTCDAEMEAPNTRIGRKSQHLGCLDGMKAVKYE